MRPQSDTSGTVEIGFGEYFLPQHAHALLLLAYELLCKFHEGRKNIFFSTSQTSLFLSLTTTTMTWLTTEAGKQ